MTWTLENPMQHLNEFYSSFAARRTDKIIFCPHWKILLKSYFKFESIEKTHKFHLKINLRRFFNPFFFSWCYSYCMYYYFFFAVSYVQVQSICIHCVFVYRYIHSSVTGGMKMKWMTKERRHKKKETFKCDFCKLKSAQQSNYVLLFFFASSCEHWWRSIEENIFREFQ